jgi:hypothetical protein
MKITQVYFLNQDKNMGMLSSKSKSPNKKQKKQEHKHYMCKTKIQQDFVVKTKQE